jgi:hypothetical protein
MVYTTITAFFDLSIVRYSKNYRTQHFGNWICFCPQVRGNTYSVGSLELTSITRWPMSESESYVMTDGQLASLSWNKAPIWDLQPDFYYCHRVAGLLVWGALPDERTDLLFTIAAGPHQHSHSWVQVLWNLRLYFTVSDLRLPFLSPLMTQRALSKGDNKKICNKNCHKACTDLKLR